MGIAYNESMFHPLAQSTDQIGRGLWQIGGPGGPVASRGLTGPQCNKGNPGLNAELSKCQAFDPIKSGKIAIELTNKGRDWLPRNSEWWSCNTATKKTKASTDSGFDENKALEYCKMAAGDIGKSINNWSNSSNCSDGSAPDGSVYKCDDPSRFSDYCGPGGVGWGSTPLNPPFTKCDNGWCVR